MTQEKATEVNEKMKEYEIHYIGTDFPGLGGGMGIGRNKKEAIAYFLDVHRGECKAIVEVLFYKNH